MFNPAPIILMMNVVRANQQRRQREHQRKEKNKKMNENTYINKDNKEEN